VDEEPQIPRRYINIRRKGRKEWRTVKAQVWDQIPGRRGEAWLKEVRPVIQLDSENRNVFRLIGEVHAALSDIGLRHRAQRFVNRAYYAGSYEEALRIAEEFVEFAKPE
jgi:hypothetical protein